MGYNRFVPDSKKILDNYLKFVIDLIIVVMAAMFFLMYLGDTSKVVGNSMMPKLKDSQTILIDRMSYNIKEPKRFDVIIYRNKDNKEKYYIKRVMGLPGEKIRIDDSVIYINGKPIKDIYKLEKTFESGYVKEEIQLENDEYFVLGDNRNLSEDSRFEYMGNVNIKNIIGKAWLIGSPFNEISIIE